MTVVHTDYLKSHPATKQEAQLEKIEQSAYPKLLSKIAEEFRNATAHTQFIITAQSPIFLNALRPEEVWVLYRNEDGYTQVRRADDIPHVTDFF